jgi:hypothetical protein
MLSYVLNQYVKRDHPLETFDGAMPLVTNAPKVLVTLNGSTIFLSLLGTRKKPRYYNILGFDIA